MEIDRPDYAVKVLYWMQGEIDMTMHHSLAVDNTLARSTTSRSHSFEGSSFGSRLYVTHVYDWLGQLTV
jgi:hypothetical protein